MILGVLDAILFFCFFFRDLAWIMIGVSEGFCFSDCSKK